MIHALVLAASESSDLGDLGYPTFLTDLSGKTLLEMWIKQVRDLGGKTSLVVSEQDIEKWNLRAIQARIGDDLEIVAIKGQTSGATCTALLAVASKNLDEQLVILNGNEYIEPELKDILGDFTVKNLDAGLVYFNSVHPRYSYARINAEGLVLETAEKNPISRNATAGVYWYKASKFFVQAAESQLLKRTSLNGQYYICPLFNELILAGKRVGGYQIPSELHHSLKSSRQLANFKGHDK